MAGNFQDDDREDAMRVLFDLYKKEEDGRSGIDAHLDIDGKSIPFELKTTSNGSVTTARDFGPDHIEKWIGRHWLIGVFKNSEEYYLYGSPDLMAPWIEDRRQYIEPDFLLVDLVASKLVLADMHSIIGRKDKYSYDDAKKLHKKQYLKAKYIELQDMGNGYSPERMLDIVKDRVIYLTKRGSTINNPHIPKSYFKGWIKIVDDHPCKLRKMVRAAIGIAP